MGSAKLLIFIPTYNRYPQISKQLEKLIPQIIGNSNVRVIVSDNNSLDDRMHSIENEYASVANLRFHRNFGNVGANANFLLAYNHLFEDEYLWLLADDTEISIDAVSVILNLATANPDLIALKAESQNSFPTVYKIEQMGIGKIFNDFNWGLISSAIYKSSYLRESLFNGFYFHNSSFPHLAILFTAMRKYGEISIVWVDSEKIHLGNSVELSSDYGLSITGFPLLFSFAPKWEQKSIAIQWIKKYGGLFYSGKERFPENFFASRQVLIEFAGIRAKILLAVAKFEFNFRKSPLGRRLDKIILKNPKLLGLALKSGRQPYKLD